MAPKKKLSVELDPKLAPSQERARATYQQILDATGELLGEVGVERLSTNMIAERAGLTPPALYRYFPNKYAVLREMGRRLMEAEDAVVFDWLQNDDSGIGGDVDGEVRRRVRLLSKVREVASSQPGATWILRVMGAVPVLREVRTESVRAVADASFEAVLRDHPRADQKRLKVATLLTTVIAGAANEMVADEPELADEITEELAKMLTLYYRDVAFSRASGQPKAE